MIKIAAGVVAFVGFFIMMGVAGADCDGKCMERSLPLTDILLYTAVGLIMFVGGTLVAIKE